MKINVSGILKNVNSKIAVEGKIEIPSVNYNGDDIPVISPIEVKALITNAGDNLLIEGSSKTVLLMKCSRCLESFNYPLENEFEEELSNKAVDGDVIHFEGDTIDLTDIVVNNILLYLPMKAICSDNCKGLCPQCGNNLNVKECGCTDENLDPRLEVLKKYLKDN